ncbi:hypothetical protein NC652_022493 [Populus alba x Populus x berolinensis]|nr:hypothetical protein NC652_022493 [Populus alba x Populus x berolinensis]
MASSLSAHSIIIHFSLTKGNEEQQQPSAPTPKHIYRSRFIQAPEVKFTSASTQKEDVDQLVFLPSTTPPQISTPHLQFPTGILLTSLVL